jgi:hypothetical protein
MASQREARQVAQPAGDTRTLEPYQSTCHVLQHIESEQMP